MQPKKPLSDAELAEFEAGQDFEALLLKSAEQMVAGKTRAVYTPVIEARNNLHATQEDFAAMLGVSHRTLQQWEQGRRQPTGPARMLIEIARKAPEAFTKAGMTVRPAKGARAGQIIVNAQTPGRKLVAPQVVATNTPGRKIGKTHA